MIYSCDSETYLIAKGNPAPKGVCLSYVCEDGTEDVMLMADALPWIKERLLSHDTLIWHNAPYDLSCIAADDPELLPLIFKAHARGDIRDTLNRQKILDNARGSLKYEWNEETGEFKAQRHSLAHLMHRIFNVWRFSDKEGDVWRLQFSLLADTPVAQWPEGPREYSLQDSRDTMALFLHQEEDRFAYLLDKEYTQNQPDWALRLMSCWGSRTCEEDIGILKVDLQEKLEVQVLICREYDLVYPKKNDKGVWKWSRKMEHIYALVEAHYEAHDLPVPMTEGGKGEVKNPKVSTSRDTLKMKAHGQFKPHPGMEAVAEMVRIGKLLSTYIPMLELGIEYAISPRYNTIIETYRTSCSKPNIQNLPRDGGVRTCWVARTGWVYGFCDYDTVEMRTLCQVYIWLFGIAAAHALLNAIKEGKDLHLVFAADTMGISYEEALERFESKDKVMKVARQGAKIGNYGSAGGMGAEAFIEYARGFGVEVTLGRAKEILQGFRDTWNMQQYFDNASWEADQRDIDLGINLLVLPGSGLIRGDVRYTACCNTPFQHLAAMGAKMALFEVAYACYAKPESPLYGCRPWLFAHDEIGMEIPFDGTEEGRIRASRAMEELRLIMKRCMEHYCPDVPIGATGAMSFRWLKGATAVFREINGEQVMVPSREEGNLWVEQKETA